MTLRLYNSLSIEKWWEKAKRVKNFVFSGARDILIKINFFEIQSYSMKKIIFSILFQILWVTAFCAYSTPSILAAPVPDFVWPPAPANMDSDNILGISTDRLRNWNITMTDIPIMIASAIEYILALVGSICVVALIYHAVCMQFASGITGDSTWVDKAKKWMKWAILGFALSMSAWFLMTKLVALLSTL